MNIFVFHTETIPDVDGGRRLYNLEGLSDKEVANIMFHKRRQETGNEFLRLHLHRVVTISVVRRSRERLAVYSLGNEGANEKEIVGQFYQGLEQDMPTLVSWNGQGFDLPVMHYRALLHGIQAPRYWDMGDKDARFRDNNYRNRYHRRHTDLMDLLAAYDMHAVAPLDEIATLLGFPGKMGRCGTQVWDKYQANQIADIRNDSETDVLNTYLVYLRFELINGNLTPHQYTHECQLLRQTLQQENKPHFNEFLANWPENS